MKSSKSHWENVYEVKQPHEVSWTQEIPSTSLEFIRGFNLSKNASIIDIGGGDSKLVDFLLKEGFHDITVLDISEKALERTKIRLGPLSEKITWVVSDIIDFDPPKNYDLWHDRATFHFLTSDQQIEKYLSIARHSVKGFLTIGTFSHDGPTKCSGLHIKQYDEEELNKQLSAGFTKIHCFTEDHITPFNTKQNFLFCGFKSNRN